MLRLCPCCNIQFELIDMISIDGTNKCCTCVRYERIEKDINWQNVKAVNISKIQDILTEINNMSVFDKASMNIKFDEINEAWVNLKDFIR